MNNELPKDVQRWEETRRKGKLNYILVNGLLAWGLPMFVVMTFFVLRKKDEPLRLDMVAISAVLWTIGGLAFGLSIWTVSEKKYQKYLRESQPKDGGPPKLG